MASNDNTDLMELGMNAMKDAKNIHVQMIREIKAQAINQPAFAKEIKADARVDMHRIFFSEPGSIRLKNDETLLKFPPPKEKPVSRRMFEYAKLGQREMTSRMEPTLGEPDVPLQ